MWHRVAPEVRNILSHAEDIARGTDRPLNTVHFLLATFVTPCKAREMLAEAGVDHALVVQTFKAMPRREEPASVLSEVRGQARQLAGSSNADEIDSGILLASLLRVRHGLASRVLRRAGVNLPELRAQVIGHLTLDIDRASSTRLRAVPTDARAPARARPDADPGDDLDRRAGALRLPPGLEELSSRARPAVSGRTATVTGRRPSSSSLPMVRPAEGGGQVPSRPVTAPQDRSARATPPTAARRPDDLGTARARADGPSAPRHRGEAPVPGRAREGGAQPRAASGHSALAAAVNAASGAAKPPAPQPAKRPVIDFELDPEEFPTLTELGRNLTQAALAGEIQPLIGRAELVDAVIDVLLMKQVNNPCLVGEAGVGKTAIAEGIAARIAGQTKKYGRLGHAIVVELQVSSLLAGTSYRGAFSERMRALRDEVAAANGRVIVFMDEIHNLMGAGAGDGPLDAANDLKTALSRGRFPLIGATTRAEYRRHIEKDPAMERRFQVIEVPEPEPEEAIAILSGIAPLYAQHHGIPYSHEAVASAVHLSKRFITDRCLPDKAIAVLDRAGAQAKRRHKAQVEADDVARAVHALTRVPMDRLLADERSRIRDLAEDLQRSIFGQRETMQRIARRIQRNYAGFSGDRPLASFLFAGPPGTGKTETACVLAQALFMVDDALVRFDMGEYADAHSTSRLLGSPPGYVGHQQPGLLSEAMHKRPYRVLLFDDIDRAAPEVVALLQQILDGGRITDNQGQTLDMRNSIIVLTTNHGAELVLAGNNRRAIGFGAPAPQVAEPDDDVAEAVFERIRNMLPGEVWGRVDEPVLFKPLDDDASRQVVRHHLTQSAERLFVNRLIKVDVHESVVDWVIDHGGIDPALGARPLRSRVETLVESFLTEGVLDGVLKPGCHKELRADSGELRLTDAPDDGPDTASIRPTGPGARMHVEGNA